MTKETQRGEGTCPRAHSKSAEEPGRAPSPPDPSRVVCIIPRGLATFRLESCFRPSLVQVWWFSISQSCRPRHRVLLLPSRTGGPASPGNVFSLSSPGLSPWCTSCPSWELWLPKETGHLFGFLCFRPECPASSQAAPRHRREVALGGSPLSSPSP